MEQQKKWVFKGRISTEIMEIENLEDGTGNEIILLCLTLCCIKTFLARITYVYDSENTTTK